MSMYDRINKAWEDAAKPKITFQGIEELPPTLPPGIDDVKPVEGHITREDVRKLRIGRKVIASGDVLFGYPEQGKRRGMISTFKEPMELYFIGWRWRREGEGGRELHGATYFEPAEEISYFIGSRNVLVVLLKFGSEGGGYIEALPEQCRLKVRR